MGERASYPLAPDTGGSREPARRSRWNPGATVAVRNRFTGGWAAGFRIEEACAAPAEAYRVRRLSDDAVLPAAFAPEDLRPT